MEKSIRYSVQAEGDIAEGFVHRMPIDLQKALTADPIAEAAWWNITSLARNEWLCWIESAKKPETRDRRIKRACNELPTGKKRPCCWPGCPHR